MTISNNMMLKKTIAAISTPPGKGGVAVIRISGDEAIEIGKKIFTPKGSQPIDSRPPRTQIYGNILLDGQAIDDGMLTVFKAPNSYTGEDIVEISCHGGVLVTAAVLEAALVAGAVVADRGEFTKRAFINGKLSLTEAEAIGTLLEAQSEAQIKLSRISSRSKLASELEALRASLVSLLSSVYARIDYPEEDLGEFSDEEVSSEISKITEKLSSLISTYKTGKAINEGISTVIIGKPNAGKSTLYNLLVGEDAAIVTDIPGTTRDVLERKVPLGDVLLKLFDTAGIRSGKLDTVEAIGIQRSRAAASSAELIFALFDGSRALDSEDSEIIELLDDIDTVKIAVITKLDIAAYTDEIKNLLLSKGYRHIIELSVSDNADASLRLIENTVAKLFTDEEISVGNDAIISSARQNAALIRARDFLLTAKHAYEIGLPQDAASSDIELALGAIAELDGRGISEDVVADIFAKFCVGK